MLADLQYRQGKLIALQEAIQEDYGWKLVHGEVFRRPSNPLLLAVAVGNGAQLCAMVGITLGECPAQLPFWIR